MWSYSSVTCSSKILYRCNVNPSSLQRKLKQYRIKVKLSWISLLFQILLYPRLTLAVCYKSLHNFYVQGRLRYITNGIIGPVLLYYFPLDWVTWNVWCLLFSSHYFIVECTYFNYFLISIHYSCCQCFLFFFLLLTHRFSEYHFIKHIF